ncbi:hypothetical protein MBO12_00325 [Candidatus Saccharibacteria bacterium]|nr:hypothetical protein [Candidatus Saccharibacteria bacterium]
MSHPQYLLATLHLPDKKRRNFHTLHDGYTPLSVTITHIDQAANTDGNYSITADCKSTITNSSHHGLHGEIHTDRATGSVVAWFVSEYRQYLAQMDVTMLEMQVWAVYQPERQRIRFAIPLPGFSQAKSRPPLEELKEAP